MERIFRKFEYKNTSNRLEIWGIPVRSSETDIDVPNTRKFPKIQTGIFSWTECDHGAQNSLNNLFSKTRLNSVKWFR